jgi:hypothetical protein
MTSKKADEGLMTACYRSIRSFAFRAKLLTANVLDVSDSTLVFQRMHDYLDEPGESVNDLAWSGRISTAAQPILFSGETLAKEAREPTQTHVSPLNAAVWQTFALKFKKESRSEKEDHWGAREKAARAHLIMTELWPDAFEKETIE